MIADRLIFVPTLMQETEIFDDGAAGEATVKVIRLVDDSRHMILVFSSRTRFRTWCRRDAHSEFDQVLLFGADLAAALGPDTWILVDKGFDNSVALPPDLVCRIKELGVSQTTEPTEAVNGKNSIEFEEETSSHSFPVPGVNGEKRSLFGFLFGRGR